jgi:hypothetical protein
MEVKLRFDWKSPFTGFTNDPKDVHIFIQIFAMVHTLLFSGHMIDKPDRPTPRFPPYKEAAAAMAIRQAIQQAVAKKNPQDFHGIAAAACGGDILFHEACRTLRIPSELYLGIPVDAFEQTSVSFAGQQWTDRYQQLTRELPVHVLFPEATADAPNEVWEKANQWMLDTALADGGATLSLLVLWDGQGGDGPGGTLHMINVAKEQGATTDIIDITNL